MVRCQYERKACVSIEIMQIHEQIELLKAEELTRILDLQKAQVSMLEAWLDGGIPSR